MALYIMLSTSTDFIVTRDFLFVRLPLEGFFFQTNPKLWYIKITERTSYEKKQITNNKGTKTEYKAGQANYKLNCTCERLKAYCHPKFQSMIYK